MAINIASARENDKCVEAPEKGTALTLTIDTTVIPAEFNNTQTARNLVTRLPYTISLNHYTHDFCCVIDMDLNELRNLRRDIHVMFALARNRK